eukprot:Hpha_TRINITY_DN13821_c0_g3::TRINITY_DN13821_c0_g3_i1::g.69990::m.69990
MDFFGEAESEGGRAALRSAGELLDDLGYANDWSMLVPNEGNAELPDDDFGLSKNLLELGEELEAARQEREAARRAAAVLDSESDNTSAGGEAPAQPPQHVPEEDSAWTNLMTANSQLASRRSNAEDWYPVDLDACPQEVRSSGRLARGQRHLISISVHSSHAEHRRLDTVASAQVASWRSAKSDLSAGQEDDTMSTGGLPWAEGGLDRHRVPNEANRPGSAPPKGEWQANEAWTPPSPEPVPMPEVPWGQTRVLAPCTHNRWDRVTKKRHSITLRCQVCDNHWKTTLESHSKCDLFYEGQCPLGD